MVPGLLCAALTPQLLRLSVDSVHRLHLQRGVKVDVRSKRVTHQRKRRIKRRGVRDFYAGARHHNLAVPRWTVWVCMRWFKSSVAACEVVLSCARDAKQKTHTQDRCSTTASIRARIRHSCSNVRICTGGVRTPSPDHSDPGAWDAHPSHSPDCAALDRITTKVTRRQAGNFIFEGESWAARLVKLP